MVVVLGLCAVAAAVALSTVGSASAVARKAGPVFTSPSSASFVEGSRGVVEISVSDRGKTVFRWGGKLPTGLTFAESGDGRSTVLAGAPAVGTAGTYPLKVTAVDSSGGYAMQTLTVTVAPISPDNPVVQMVSPSTSSASDVTITGVDLQGAKAVLFGGVAATFTENADGTSIIADVPSRAAGTVDVTVTSSGGTSPASVDDRFTYNVAPQAPQIATVIPEGLGIVVSWAPALTDDQVTAYRVTARVMAGYEATASAAVPASCESPPPVSAPVTVKSARVSGVCAGVPYTVSVTATNQWGTSSAGVASNAVVPLVAHAPTAPLITSVMGRPGALIVAWSPPTEAGGDALGSYVLSAQPTKGTTKNVSVTVPSKTALVTMKGLENGIRYKLTLTARSAAGVSLPAHGSGTPSATDKPGAPSGLRVVPDSKGRLVVTWSAPSNTGSRGLSGYVLTYASVKVPGVAASGKGGGGTMKLPASATSSTLSRLVLSDYYRVSISAKSSAGTGQALTTATPVTPTVTLAAETRALPAATMKSLLSQTVDSAGDGHILTWPASTAFKPALSPGSILVGPPAAAAPQGLLVVVQTVSTSRSGKYLEVDTTPANLGDAFRTLSFSSLRDTDPTLTLTPYSYQGASATGSVTFNAAVSMSFSINCSHSVFGICYHWSASGEVTGSLSASEQLNAVLNAGAPVAIPFPSTQLGTQVFAVGYVIVTLTESLDFTLTLTTNPSVTFTETASASLVGWTAWSSSSGFSHGHTAAFSASVATSYGTVNSTSTADLQVALNVCAWESVLCGDVAVDPTLTAVIKTTGSPYFSLCPSVTINVGFSIDLLFWSTSNNAQIAQIPSSSLGGCYTSANAPATLSVSPYNAPTVPIGTNVQSFTATRSDGKAPTNSWSLLNGIPGDSISAAGELSTVAPGSRTLWVQDVDSTLPVDFPVTAPVTVGNTCAYAAPGTLVAQLVHLPFTLVTHVAQASWQAPANAGCNPVYPLTYFAEVVYPTGATAYTAGPGTNLNFWAFTPGLYKVYVAAWNGNAISPVATKSFYQPY
ncbi:MAG TPA: fibronectin type III domain-containing protein [Gaiellaceae bacterium]|nr:fibronectin type III domain-containing protein [Gaiellaceae bacterium]